MKSVEDPSKYGRLRVFWRETMRGEAAPVSVSFYPGGAGSSLGPSSSSSSSATGSAYVCGVDKMIVEVSEDGA